jgi:putative acetyltransferase
MKGRLEVLSSVEPRVLREFLLNLGKHTLYHFNHFGKITHSNIDIIVQRELSRKDRIRFFSSVNGELIAYSFLTLFEKPSKKHNCILGIVIGEKWQGKGYGKKICAHMIRKAWQKRFGKIWLNVYSDNPRAIALYRSVGFEVEGIFMADEMEGTDVRHIVSMATFRDRNFGKKSRLAIWDRVEKS